MKKFLLGNLLCLLATPVWALSGGPFDNDSPLTTGGEGTYQGVATGTESNLTGIVQFAWSTTTGSTGIAVFWNEGVQRVMELQAVVNIPGRTIAGVTTTLSDNDATASFTAHIDGVNSAVLTFEGEGFYAGPEQLQGIISTAETNTVSIIDTVTEGTSTIETTSEITIDEDTDILDVDYAPFTISGLRTSVQVGSFEGEPTSSTATATSTN